MRSGNTTIQGVGASALGSDAAMSPYSVPRSFCHVYSLHFYDVLVFLHDGLAA